MPEPGVLLIADGDEASRAALRGLFHDSYPIIEASCASEALAYLENGQRFCAVVLDAELPEQSGFDVLQTLRERGTLAQTAVLMTTRLREHEAAALRAGADDILAKPFDPELARARVDCAVAGVRLREVLLRNAQLEATQYDELTGLPSKGRFFSDTRAMLDAQGSAPYVFVRFDIDRFQLVNSFFGEAEGNRLLRFIADDLRRAQTHFPPCTIGRIEADIFCLCLPFDRSAVEHFFIRIRASLAAYNRHYDIVPSLGLYIIEDNGMPVEQMYNRAALAAKHAKGHYIDVMRYYDETMSAALIHEQTVTNEMNPALADGQFIIYLQPKYHLGTGMPDGGEALVRWQHPKHGLVSPDEFIPIFERNGFILQLDHYVWRQVCAFLRARLDAGDAVRPISVNVSRVNLYNTQFCTQLTALVDSYQLPRSLLQLELTETAYTENPAVLRDTLNSLRNAGFTIMMDDFGSGYSSLTVLKDVKVDALKLDMRFLSPSCEEGRGGNILSSVVRMAKRLGIPTIAEGVNSAEQAELLRSVGCDYAQGYYFAHPMPMKDYVEHVRSFGRLPAVPAPEPALLDVDDLWTPDALLRLLSGGIVSAVSMYEFYGDDIELLRVNPGFWELVGTSDPAPFLNNCIDIVLEEDRAAVLQCFRTAVETGGVSVCDYRRRLANGEVRWFNVRLKHLRSAGGRHLLCGALNDITRHKSAELAAVARIESQRSYFEQLLRNVPCGIVQCAVDSSGMRILTANVAAMRMFGFSQDEFNAEARFYDRYLHPEHFEMLTLELQKLLTGPTGTTVIFDYPMLSTNGSTVWVHNVSQLAHLETGEPVFQCVLTDITEQKRIEQHYAAASQRDQLTGLYNRRGFEMQVSARLAEDPHSVSAFLLLDLDDFKSANDTFGHLFGDEVLAQAGRILLSMLRKNDIIARFGGDEFAVFLPGCCDCSIAQKRASEICTAFSDYTANGGDFSLTCSVGVALAPFHGLTFRQLYHNADHALYRAKCAGKNQYSLCAADHAVAGQ